MNKLVLLSTIMLFLGACSVPRAVGPYKVITDKNTKVNLAPDEVVVVKPVKPIAPTESLNSANDTERASVREEVFKTMYKEDNDKIKVYSVIIGSFSIENNAINLKKHLQPEYSPIIVMNEKGMFRVILASYNNIEEARKKINEIANQFQGAWVLMQKK
jgi:cell division protein FtsN